MKAAVIYKQVSARELVDNYSLPSQTSARTAYWDRWVHAGVVEKGEFSNELQKLLIDLAWTLVSACKTILAEHYRGPSPGNGLRRLSAGVNQALTSLPPSTVAPEVQV